MNTIPKVDWANRHNASIDDYLSEAAFIWERDRTERTVTDLWLNVIAHTNHVVKNARLSQPKQVIDSLADTMMYLLSFLSQCRYSAKPEDIALRLTTEPSDLIWNKYPATCPACLDDTLETLLSSKNSDLQEPTPCHLFSAERYIKKLASEYRVAVRCTCPAQFTFTGARHHFWSKNDDYLIDFRLRYAEILRRQGDKPSSVSELERMFAVIFGRSCYTFSLERMALFVQEEVADVAEAIKDCYTYDDNIEPWSEEVALRRMRRVQEELADVFSCLFSVLLKIKFECSNVKEYVAELSDRSTDELDLTEEFSFGDLIWSKYGRSQTSGKKWDFLRCPRCEDRPCRCPRRFLNNRSDGVKFRDPLLVDAVA
ncbi:MAG TPA: hypothetical protein VFI24_23365 [Pyrinomonadaceae bacterium]|nr:hypothetical protein [Pyrinomonadaceae bacterium]